MKKFLCAILAAVMVLSLAACGGEEMTTTVLTMEQDGITIDYTLEAEGDVVKKIIQKSTLDGSVFDEATMDLMLQSAEGYKEAYEAYAGVTYELKEDGTNLVETITIDTTDMEMLKELSAAGLVPMDTENADVVSLEKTIANLKELGMTEK